MRQPQFPKTMKSRALALMAPKLVSILFIMTGSVFSQDSAAPAAPVVPVNESATAADEPKKFDPEELKKSIKKISDHEFMLGEMRLDTQTKTLRFPAALKIVKGPLEYLIVNENGSAHEALFITKITPFELNVAMLLLGFKPSETFFRKDGPDSFPQHVKGAPISRESSFEVLVEWKDKDGKEQSVAAESWVRNLQTSATVSAGSWVYNASFLTEKGNLAAQEAGNIIALYIDPVALANNPRKGNEMDDIWESKPAITKEGEAVTLAFKMAAVAANEPAEKDSDKPLPKDSSKPKVPNSKKSK